MKKKTKDDLQKLWKVYKHWCKTVLCCKESSKVGRTRRGRKKGKTSLFPYPKRGKHTVVSGVTIKAE